MKGNDHCLPLKIYIIHTQAKVWTFTINPSLPEGIQRAELPAPRHGQIFSSSDILLLVGATSYSNFLFPVTDPACVSTEDRRTTVGMFYPGTALCCKNQNMNWSSPSFRTNYGADEASHFPQILPKVFPSSASPLLAQASPFSTSRQHEQHTGQAISLHLPMLHPESALAESHPTPRSTGNTA